jgi:hypothetical protein
MKYYTLHLTLILCVLSQVTGCSSGTDSNPQDSGNAPTSKQTLVVKGECNIESCGAVPVSMSDADSVSCASGTSASCDWAVSSDATTVSYRYCADTECPQKPVAECPDTTYQVSQTCGSENDGPCVWTTRCIPPRNTTPCPEATGCDGIPVIDIGIICENGTVGGFACVTDGEKCYLERNCD